MQKNLSLQKQMITSIYIGGGTPSLLDIAQWDRLSRVLFKKIDLSCVREWSVECNPESFTIKKARMYADSGVTRLTFGIQSLSPRELSICGRIHSAQKALDTINDPRLGDWFNSIGVDLMYSLPGQTPESLDHTLTQVLSVSSIKHLSAYELILYEHTPFGRHSRKLPLPSDEQSVAMYELIGHRCSERGMKQYEISNYALPGFESIHNKMYWSHKPYLGLGCSAHSYFHPRRWSNVSDVKTYISAISNQESAMDFEEQIGPYEMAREMIFLGLRTKDGIDADSLYGKTGVILDNDPRSGLLQHYLENGWLERRDSKWIPTSKGLLFSDKMARELI